MKDEPFKLHIFRYFLYTLIIIIYILYLCYLIYNIVTDTPTLKVDRIFLNEIDVPDVEICGTSPDLKILRCDIETNNNGYTPIDGCNKYLLPGIIDYGIFGDYCLTFKANKTIKFVNPESSMDGLRKIGFYFYENATSAEAKTLGIASLTIQLTPPGNQMDKATLSEFRLQLNFIAGMANYAAVVKFKTSTYRSILPGDASAIFGFNPNYHVTPNIENYINYFPFNNNPYDIPAGTTGYFSIAAGSFIQEQTSEERSNTILSSIASAGGAFGVMAGTLVFFFGDFRLSPWGFVHRSHTLIQSSKDFYKRSRFYPDYEFKFSQISEEDKALLVNEFRKIRNTINYQLYYQNDIEETNKDRSSHENSTIRRLYNWLLDTNDRFTSNIYNWLLNTTYIEKMFKAYDADRGYLKFSSMDENDERLLNDEFNKIRHVIDIYLLNISKDPEKFAAYKYERKIKFSNNLENGDKKLLNDEFHKIRKLIDKYFLGTPDLDEIFNAYDSDYNNDRRFLFSKDMDERDEHLIIDEFNQIRHVIFNHLLEIPKNEKIFQKYNKPVQELRFSNNMNEKDKESLANEFFRIKHVINSHLFNERKNLEVFIKYKKERELKFSNRMNKKDKKLLNDEFHKLRYIIDSFLLSEPEIQEIFCTKELIFSSKMDEEDKKLLKDEFRKIRYVIDNYILDYAV
ncbi:hypothetical protein RclHR1_11810001 [Rhizophagus clarus]|uniref:Uncharacterized protein n=1 Tax=Rhizophagus clarus TaxID=94130 RepID=A0A2Z6Q530_9GLOM|nr:hypothetical protein RclHR1_11810001 [Rhizophagus clarus]